MVDNIELMSENLVLLEPILMYVVSISLLTNLAVWLFKTTAPKFPDNLLPLAATIIGILIGLLSLFIPELVGDLSIGGHILAGAISGLLATKTYDAILKPTADALFNKTDNKYPNNKL